MLFEMEESMVLTSRGDKNAIKPILADTTKATLQVLILTLRNHSLLQQHGVVVTNHSPHFIGM